MSAIPRPHLFTRLWAAYTSALARRPLRTKMIQSGVLYISADLVAQVGIEGKSLGRAVMGEDGEGAYDPVRTARLTLYGSAIFAPLAHVWLGTIERIKMASRIKTLATKVALDCGLWSPFVTFMFPTCLGLLEGKSIEEVRKKVAYGWFPTWQKAVCVFGPTQIINFTFVPPQHRLLTVQSVALGWNVFLSWQNNRNNKTLALAEMRLAEAQAHMVQVQHEHGHGHGDHQGVMAIELSEEEVRSRKELQDAERAVEKAEQRKEGLKKEGGEMGVGVKMAWS
ncbi:hypothetical protein I317_04814 [Kwoniella heveanensis CBS 569]|uniref:Protein SYM1 n=1 Tax=Kwoniella heveanensis BCC8398 TaxID=1296120 RepID=A0A1B9H431_9TREE|nr:hypothetical protein I316_00255 [Kwoniella heveanensis BCC8398]OCF41333.1 hypothetical protein I317_04814 [Kwoniella heveanensis CBS 569]